MGINKCHLANAFGSVAENTRTQVLDYKRVDDTNLCAPEIRYKCSATCSVDVVSNNCIPAGTVCKNKNLNTGMATPPNPLKIMSFKALSGD